MKITLKDSEHALLAERAKAAGIKAPPKTFDVDMVAETAETKEHGPRPNPGICHADGSPFGMAVQSAGVRVRITVKCLVVKSKKATRTVL